MFMYAQYQIAFDKALKQSKVWLDVHLNLSITMQHEEEDTCYAWEWHADLSNMPMCE